MAADTPNPGHPAGGRSISGRPASGRSVTARPVPAHRSAPGGGDRRSGSGGRRAAGGHRSRGRRGRRPGPGLVAALCLLLLAGACVVQQVQRSDGGSASGSSSSGSPDSASGSRDRQSDGDAEGEADGGTDAAAVPQSGSGEFVTASGGSRPVGEGGKLLRYEVAVEDSIDLSADEVAAEVEGVLADERGWTARGEWSFQRVDDGGADFVVRLATPDTVDDICGQYGLDTGGEVSCRVGEDVVLNLKRWMLATEFYVDDVPGYRALVVNHEVGHFLGHGHETCAGPGRPAPVMMQQIKGLKGCVPNVWPFDEDGNAITGPSVP